MAHLLDLWHICGCGCGVTKGCNPSVVGTGGGLFIRSGSEAHPFSAKRLPAILNL
jgi:hypothetical protein